MTKLVNIILQCEENYTNASRKPTKSEIQKNKFFSKTKAIAKKTD